MLNVIAANVSQIKFFKKFILNLTCNKAYITYKANNTVINYFKSLKFLWEVNIFR